MKDVYISAESENFKTGHRPPFSHGFQAYRSSFFCFTNSRPSSHPFRQKMCFQDKFWDKKLDCNSVLLSPATLVTKGIISPLSDRKHWFLKVIEKDYLSLDGKQKSVLLILSSIKDKSNSLSLKVHVNGESSLFGERPYLNSTLRVS